MAVLSYLALRFSTHPENLATEALAYILRESSCARSAICNLLESLSGRSLNVDRFETQAPNEDLSRPDLIGIASNGAKSVFIEVKFWAGLTEAQPNGYLAAMQQPGVLFFVAPEARLRSLWGELLRRLEDAGLGTPSWAAHERLVCTVADHVVCATSWWTLLSCLQTEAETAGDTRAAADLRQLLALCDHMDTDAFLPLSSEEMTAATGRRILQFGAIASDLTDALVQRGVADVKGLRATHWSGTSGRYLYLKGHGAFLHFSASKWTDWGQSPVWLTLKGPSSFKHDPSVAAALRRAAIEFIEDHEGCYIPIRLAIGLEREAVMARAQTQLMAVAEALPNVARGGAPDPTENPSV